MIKTDAKKSKNILSELYYLFQQPVEKCSQPQSATNC